MDGAYLEKLGLAGKAASWQSLLDEMQPKEDAPTLGTAGLGVSAESVE